MATYLSPGVYVEEIASGSAPIVGIGTSIAAFIGMIKIETTTHDSGTNPSESQEETEDITNKEQDIGGGTNPTPTYKIKKVEGEKVGNGDDSTLTFELSSYLVDTTEFKVTVGRTNQQDGVSLEFDDNTKKYTIKFTTPPRSNEPITVDYNVISIPKGEIKLCTNFSEFNKFFGDFSSNASEGQNTLAHAVYGFFRNGGTRCYVSWISEKSEVKDVLEKFEAIDEITIVAAPGNAELRDDIKGHCEKMGDRIAILDSEEEIDLSNEKEVESLKPFTSDYAALYFPWIEVYDPATKRNIFIPPSGHMAGVYARVDGQRGVHKAPANETILGALDLKYNLSKTKQDGLNPKGINCIRKLNGNIRVWGARTLGGDDNGEFKYINVRRLFLSLKASIEKGTQWTVFEPNDAELWAKIRRNVNAYLTNVWRSGALFGTTPQEAFYVKCDAENNPLQVRDLGQVIIEIGVAPVKPAEFVIFRLSQWSGSGQ